MPDRKGLAAPLHGDNDDVELPFVGQFGDDGAILWSVSGWFDTINVATLWLDSMAM